MEKVGKDLEPSAGKLGLRLPTLHAASEAEITAAFAAFAEQGIAALFVDADPIFLARREQIVALAARHAIPTIYSFREFPVAGGLMSYGTSITDAYRQVGVYAAAILNGAKPSEIPVIQSTKFELVINLTTAKALGISVPPLLLALADEVIE